jgi:hypothetical protein
MVKNHIKIYGVSIGKYRNCFLNSYYFFCEFFNFFCFVALMASITA